MKRRNFIHTTISGTFILSIAGIYVLNAKNLTADLKTSPFEKIDQNWQIFDDGRFNIETESIKIKNCFPAKPMMPVGIPDRTISAA